MTNEEAIARIKEHMIIHKMEEPRAIHISEALNMAIKALEQEPCDDCVSREQAKVAIRDRFKDLPSRVEINTILNELPSVTPQPKAGHWIDKFGGVYRCSCCREIISIDIEIEHPNGITYKYCPNCGCRMLEGSGKE